MSSRMFLTVGCALIALFVSVDCGAQELPIPDEWDTHYAWFLVANPDYVPAPPDEEKALTSAHIQFQLRLQETGQAIVAGGLGEGPDESIGGLTILRAESLAEAQAIAGDDPAVRAGRLVSWVREWWVPAGRLP
jgi:uncharacterized protein YciI